MNPKKSSAFKFLPFSQKQKKLLTWWLSDSPYCTRDMVIADGSIRSGKTIAMLDSFLMWSLDRFVNQVFIVAGRSAGTLKRNVLRPMFQILTAKGIPYSYNRSDNYIIIGSNVYYCFGAVNESSQDVLQGLTAAGALADEVALFPQSFIEQMIARCSVAGSRVWMNCNPESPYHYIKTDFIDKAKEKNILHLHFTLDDNLSLSAEIKERYRRMYSGVWFDRMILGLWRIAEGIIFDMFSDANLYTDKTRPEGLAGNAQRYIAIDYGTTNPMVFLDIYDDGHDIWVEREYYYNSRDTGAQKTDAEYMDDLKLFVGIERPRFVIIDPSAASFKELLRREGFRVKEADNEVNDGIRVMAMMIQLGWLHVHERCKNFRKELQVYAWDEKAAIERGEEKPIKRYDHACDACRYYCKTMIKRWRLPT